MSQGLEEYELWTESDLEEEHNFNRLDKHYRAHCVSNNLGVPKNNVKVSFLFLAYNFWFLERGCTQLFERYP